MPVHVIPRHHHVARRPSKGRRARWLSRCLASSAIALAPSTLIAQETSAGDRANVTVLSQTGAVAADHPLASAIGAQVLARGGSAADAGAATLLALGVLNPFASGLGGGGFCLYRSAETGRVRALDFRETAPARATRDMYIVDGKADPELSRRGGLAVGVPGEAMGLWTLHEAYGALPWSQVVEPAYRIAHSGFFAGELLPKRLKQKNEALQGIAQFKQAFFGPSGQWGRPVRVDDAP